MKHMLATIVGALDLLAATSGSAAAQASFDDLQTTLKTGDVVSVRDDAGNQTRGTVESVGRSLRITAGGVAREFAPQQVWEVRRRGDSLSNGLIIGALSGAAAGVVIGAAMASLFANEGHDPAGAFVGFLALGLGAGVGIGAGLDAAFTGSTVVYRRPARKVTVAPVMTPRAQAIRVGVAF